MKGRVLVTLVVIITVIDVAISVKMSYSGSMGLIAFLLFSSAWVVLFLREFDALSHAFERLFDEFRALPEAQRWLYVMLMLYIYAFLLIPLITPLLLASTGVVISYVIAKPLSRKTAGGALVLFVVGSAVLTFLAVALVAPYYAILTRKSVELFIPLLASTIGSVYEASIILATGASIADFIKLIYQGAQQYDPSVEIPERELIRLQVLLSLAMLSLWIILGTLIVRVASWLLTLSVLGAVIRKLRGLDANVARPTMLTAVLYALYIIGVWLPAVSELPVLPADIIPLAIQYQTLVLVYASLIVWGYILVNVGVSHEGGS